MGDQRVFQDQISTRALARIHSQATYGACFPVLEANILAMAVEQGSVGVFHRSVASELVRYLGKGCPNTIRSSSGLAPTRSCSLLFSLGCSDCLNVCSRRPWGILVRLRVL